MFTVRGTLTAGGLIATVVLGLWIVLIATAPQQVVREEGGILATQQSNDALIGGCGPLYSFPDATADSGTVPATTASGVSNRLGYPTTVPMRGQFWDEPVKDRFWEPDEADKPVAEQMLRNLWDGDMVAYYTHLVPAEDVKTLVNLSRARPELRLFVVPWEQRLRGSLPRGRALALATWNSSQTCHALSVPAVIDFRDAAPATAAPGADGTRPPVLRRTPPIGVSVE